MLRVLVFLGILLAPATAWAYCDPPITNDAYARQEFAACVSREQMELQSQIAALKRMVRELETRLLNLEARGR